MFQQRCDRQIFRTLQRQDRLTLDSVFHVSEFCADIQDGMLVKESKWSVDYLYMDRQEKINETIRSQLVDWLLQVQYNFKLLPESLFLTCNIIDRYFQSRQISSREVQLVAVAAMLIATKYEEIYPPQLQDYVHISENVFTGDQILDMELKILVELDFDMQLTSAYRFLERFAKLCRLDSVTTFLAQFMLELGLLDSKMHQFAASLQAVSAIYLAGKFLQLYNGGDAVPGLGATALVHELGLSKQYSPEEVRNCASCFEQLATLIQTSAL